MCSSDLLFRWNSGAICLLLNNLNTCYGSYDVLVGHQLKYFSNWVKQVCCFEQGETEINLQ